MRAHAVFTSKGPHIIDKIILFRCYTNKRNVKEENIVNGNLLNSFGVRK